MVIIVIEDFLIRQNYSYRVLIVLAGAVLIPLVAGYLYRALAKQSPPEQKQACDPPVLCRSFCQDSPDDQAGWFPYLFIASRATAPDGRDLNLLPDGKAACGCTG
jgi:hypothetical protein